ncbi:MAG: peptidylprolyl isomerase [Geodermatophilaceae bacterium]|nr:peptidylprolyl isomerase [Geodermatophilaceae bacterium]
MPTNKQKREAAQRHLQRQLERRAALAKKRRQRNVIAAAALSIVVVLGVVFLIISLNGEDPNAVADPAVTPTAPVTTPEASAVPGECTYIPAPDASTNPNVTDVGLPSTPAPTEGTVELAVTTDQGDMTFTLDRALAPCAVQSFTYLASQSFFDGSPCHRLVNEDIFGVLQCGDPSGTGMGGPGYAFAQEAPAGDSPYTKGTIAMANSGQPDTTGSQFFIMFVDTQLAPDYSVVGTVTAGLDVVEKVAAAGNDGSFESGAGGGAPNLPITITSVTEVS